MSERERGNQNQSSQVEIVAAGARDMTACEPVRQLFIRCRRAMRDGLQCIVIDLQAVDSADTKLIACLVALYNMAHASSVRLELWVSRAVLDVVEICRLHPLIDRTMPAR